MTEQAKHATAKASIHALKHLIAAALLLASRKISLAMEGIVTGEDWAPKAPSFSHGVAPLFKIYRSLSNVSKQALQQCMNG